MTDIEKDMLFEIKKIQEYKGLMEVGAKRNTYESAASACYEIHKRELEDTLMKICAEISRKSVQCFNDSGSESYSERCGLHDAKSIVYKYTEKYRVECENIEMIRSKRD